MIDISDILNYFPKTDKIINPRDSQIEVLEKVDNLIESGKDRIIICAPTGSGKSGIAIALLNKYGGIYTSPLNVLVDQIKDDFDPRYIISLKGREHYQCIANTENGYVSCADGYCQIKKCSLCPDQPRECKDCKEFDCPCSNCLYTKQKSKYLNSNAGNTNFTMFQIGIVNEKELVVIDECDDIESFIRMNHSFTINESILSSDFEEHVLILEEREIELEELIKSLEIKMNESVDIDESRQYNKEKRNAERQRNNILTLLDDWHNNGKIWCITRPDNLHTRYEPIIVDRFLDKLLEDKIAVLMSATPKKMDGYEFIEVESSFPSHIRPWKYVPMGKMSLSHRDNTIPMVAQFLSILKGKTVVHCNSYAVANTISRELDMLNATYLKQVNYQTCNPLEKNRKDIVEAFKKSVNPNEILLSVNLARGVDFPEEDITNNVIVVLPWPNPTEPLVRAKNRILGAEWQHIDMANTIMQAYGRVNRNDRKQTMTYILDLNFNDVNGRGVTKNWFDKHRDLFYNWFLEAEYHRTVGDIMCPVCGNDYPAWKVYNVKYDDYKGLICHDCNVKKLNEVSE